MSGSPFVAARPLLVAEPRVCIPLLPGDRIVGVGLQYPGAARLSNIWVHVDWAGDSIQAASSVGASDGANGANAGDLSVFSLGGSGNERFRSKQYSVFTGPTDGSDNFITPYGMNATTASPARGFAVLAGGSTIAATSAQYFINLDAIGRSNGGAGHGEGLLGPSTKVGFLEADAGRAGADGPLARRTVRAEGATTAHMTRP